MERKITKFLKGFAVMVVLVLASVQGAFAVTKTATISANTTWAAITWSPAGAPVAGDDVVLTVSGTPRTISSIPTSIPSTGNFASFTVGGTGTLVLTLTGSSSTIFTNRLVCNQSVTLSSISVNQGAMTSNASTVAAGKTLTIPSLCFVGVGTGGVLTVSGTVAINGNATGLLTSANTNVVVASGGAVTYTLTGQACQPPAMTVNTGGTLTINGSSGTNSISTLPAGGISMGGTFRIQGNLSSIGGSNAITYTSGSTLWYNTASFTASALEWPASNSPENVTQQLTTTSNTITVPGSRTIAGTLTMSGGRMAIGSNTLTLQGPITGMTTTNSFTGSTSSNLSISGNNIAASTIFFNTTTAGTTNALNNFTINRTGTGNTVTLGNAVFLNSTGTLALTAGVLALAATNPAITINGALSGSGTITGNTSAGMVIGGTGSLGSNLTFTTGGQSLLNLTLNRTSSGVVTLGSPLTVGTTSSGVITLTNGNIISSGTNLLTAANTTTGAISGGSASSYVQGPLVRGIPNNATSSTYVFPIGNAASTFRPIELLTLATTGTAGSIRFECVTGATGGTAGEGLGSLSSSRYYVGSVSTVTITNASVRITESGLASTSRIAQSATLTGTYFPLVNAATPSTTIQSTTSLDYALNYLVVGDVTGAPTLCGNYTVGPTGDFPKLMNVANVLSQSTLTCDVVFELQTTYNGTTGEYGTLTFSQWGNTGGPWKATVRPITGATALVTSGDPGSTNDFISFNGVSLLTFDGVPGGSTSASTIASSQWTISNTRTTSTIGGVIDFSNSCTSDTLKFLTITGAAANTVGVIGIGTSTTGSGNANLFIKFNKIGSLAATFPTHGIYSAGSSGFPNSDVYIQNNEIYNFGGSGITVANTHNGSNWNITDNSFYESTATPSPSSAISVISQATGVGGHTITGNYIGGQGALATGSNMTTSASTFTAIDLAQSTGASTDVSGNTIKSISGVSFTGISIGNGTFDVNGNTITGIAASGLTVRGIDINTNCDDALVEGNTITSIAQTYTSASPVFYGIYSNVVASGTNVNIIGNTIHSLSNANTSSAATIGGILFSSSTNGTNSATGNFIKNLSLGGTATGSFIYGINIASGVAVTANNMIHLGLTAANTSIATALSIVGIYDVSSDFYPSYIYHNSVFIGGTGVGTTTTNTYAFRRNMASGVSTAGNDMIQNNIFYNGRANNTTGGAHFAIGLNSGTAVTSDYNILYAPSANGGNIGQLNTTTHANITAWRGSFTPNPDVNSVNADPLYLSTNTASTVNLHIDTVGGSPVESAGTAVAAVTTDFDGDSRATFSPTDIGADAGYFSPIAISYTGSITADCSTGDRTISDVSISAIVTPVPTSGSDVPRIYYNKNNGTWYSQPGTLTSGDGTSGLWDFTVVAADMGGVSGGDIIYYFVIAEDGSSNIVSNPSAGLVATDVHTVTTEPTTPLNLTVASPLSGTVTVGTAGGETFATLNGTSGLFAAINANGLIGDLTVNITTNLTETATTPLNAITSLCGGPWAVLIQPSAASARTVTTSLTTPAISLNGADNVTIDGRDNQTGTTSYLTIQSSAAAGASNSVITFANDAQDNTVAYCTIKGNNSSNATGLITFGNAATGGSGNSGNTIDHCDITYYTLYKLATAIYSNNTTSSTTNSTMAKGNSITYNNIFDIHSDVASDVIGIYITANGNGPNWDISYNNLYSPTDYDNSQFGIVIEAGSNSYSNRITYNLIGGDAAPSGGVISGTWLNTASAFYRTVVNPIYVNVGGSSIADSTVISNNQIKNMEMSFNAAGVQVTFIGIQTAEGYLNIHHNTVGDGTSLHNIYNKGTLNGSTLQPWDMSFLYGIWNTSLSDVIIDNNIVAGLTTNNSSSYVCGIRVGAAEFTPSSSTIKAGKNTITNNILGNIRSGSASQNFAFPGGGVGIMLYTTSNSNLVEDNLINGVYCNLAGAYNVRSIGLSLDGDYVTNAGGGLVNRNRIANITNSNTGASATFNPQAYGILTGFIDAPSCDGSFFTLTNNQIVMDNPYLNASNDLSVVGIRDMNASGSVMKYYNNSIYITGDNIAGGANASACFYSDYTHNHTHRNNVYVNNRGGGGNHRALLAGSTTWNGGSSDYNFFATRNTSVANYWNGANRTFANWQSLASSDANSLYAQVISGTSNYTTDPTTATVDPDDLFVDPTDPVTAGAFLHIETTDGISYQFVDTKGTDLTSEGVTTDVDGQTRPTTPDFGADEMVSSCATPTITLGSNPSVCYGTSLQFGNLTYSATTESPDLYSIVWGATALGAGFTSMTDSVLPSSPIGLKVPASVAANTYTGTLTVKNSSTGCVSSNYNISVIVNAQPAITPGSNPAVCYSAGSQNANLTYTSPSGSPDLYSIDWAGTISDVTDASLAGSPIVIPVPAATAAGTYTGTLTVKNNTTGCVSGNYSISVTVQAPPAIDANGYSPGPTSAGFVNSICAGSNTGFAVTATGDGLTYQWQVNTGSGWNDITTAGSNPTYADWTTNALDVNGVAAGNNGYLYRAIVSGTCPSPATSADGLLTVNTAPNVTADPVNASVCVGGDGSFSATATGTGISHQWQVSTNNGLDWANVSNGGVYSGATTNVLGLTGVTSGMDGYQYRDSVSGGCTPSDISAAATLDVIGLTNAVWLGGTSTDWNTSANWCPSTPTSTTDVVINSGTTYQPVITTAAECRDLQINNGASVTLNAHGYLQLFGDMALSGTGAYTHTAGIVELKGAATQLLPRITADSIIINNTNGVELGGTLTVRKFISLFDGVLTTDTAIVDVRDTMVSAVTSRVDTSWIHGYLRRAVGDTGIYIFPVGSDVYNELATVDLRANSRKALGGIDSLTAYFNTSNVSCSTVPTGGGGPYVNGTEINNLLNAGFWTIHPDTSTYTGINYNVTLREKGFTNPPAAANRMGVIKRATCSDSWIAPGTHVNLTQTLNTMTSTAIAVRTLLNAFSDFGIGFNGSGALPVTMLYIEAEPMENSYIEVRWATALEINNYGFEVERSTDGLNWTKIGFVEGNNNSSIEIPYSFNDVNVTPSVRYYYRLKQVDYDGKFEHTDMVTAIINPGSTFTVMDFRPNPTYSTTNLVINSGIDQEVTIDVFNIVGQKVISKTLQIVKGNNQPIEFDFNGMASGTYSAVVSTANQVHTQKLVVTR